MNDLGFVLSSNRKFSAHCVKVQKKALRVSANIFRSFRGRDTAFLMKMFDTYVRPVVEYGSSVWSPYTMKDIDLVERVLRT